MSTRQRRGEVALLALLLVWGVAGCGYSLRSSLPPHIRTIHVRTLENRTQEPGIEALITQALVEAVVTSGRVQLAASPAQADAVLEGAVVEYGLTSLAFDRAANVAQYRLQIALSLVLKDRVRDTVIWRQDRVADRADFRVAGTVAGTLAQEDAALRRAAVEVSRAIVSLAFEGF